MNSLNFLIVLHISKIECCRSFQCSTANSHRQSSKENLFPLGKGPEGGWPKNINSFWQFPSHYRQTSKKKIILTISPLPLWFQWGWAKNWSSIPSHFQPTEAGGSVPIPHSAVLANPRRELIFQSLDILIILTHPIQEHEISFDFFETHQCVIVFSVQIFLLLDYF